MKNIISILLLLVFAVTGCKKDPIVKSKAFSFQNSAIELDVVSTHKPSSSNFVTMHFFNDSSGIVISYDGKIYKTYDKCVSWTLKYTNPTPNQPLNQVLFTDKNIGYAVGGANWCNGSGCKCPGGIVLKTMDAGETWAPIFELQGELEFNGIANNSKGDLFLIQNGFSGPNKSKSQILKSADGGTSWTLVSNFDYELHKIIFNENVGFCTVNNGNTNMLRSLDNGDTWNNTAILTEYRIIDMAFKNNIGFCVTYNSIYKTLNNGETWAKLNYVSNYSNLKLNLLSENSCLIWGSGQYSGGCFGYSNGAYSQTQNGGLDWTANEFKKIMGGIRFSSFYSATEGYVFADEWIKVTVR